MLKLRADASQCVSSMLINQQHVKCFTTFHEKLRRTNYESLLFLAVLILMTTAITRFYLMKSTRPLWSCLSFVLGDFPVNITL